jgi:tetratricopeptide (TPR) repeat protein
MGKDDWFRGSAWDDEAKQVFRKKVARARYQKSHYLRLKASAISDDHPFDALALYDEYIDADDENISNGNYSKSMVYLKLGNINKALELMDNAMGESGWDMHSPAILEFAFLVGLHKQAQHYQRALTVLKALDDLAQNSTGRPFERNFAGSAGAAFILYELGQSENAKYQAEASLRLALAETGPFPENPYSGRVPQLPKEWMSRLIIIADIQEDSKLGPRPLI